MSYNIFVDIGSSSDSSPEFITSISSLLRSGGTIESSSDSSPHSASSLVSDNNPPPSNCVNVIILPVCSFGNVAQIVYGTARRIAINSEYGGDVYAIVLELFSTKTTSYDYIVFLVLGTYTR